MSTKHLRPVRRLRPGATMSPRSKDGFPHMGPGEFRKAIATLGWTTQREAGRQTGYTRETINAFANGRETIPHVLAAYIRCTLTQPDGGRHAV